MLRGKEPQDLVIRPYKAVQGQEVIHFWGESMALRSGFWRPTLASSALDTARLPLLPPNLGPPQACDCSIGQ